jgi:hypothetical protein
MMGKGTGRVTALAAVVFLLVAGRGIAAQQPSQQPAPPPAQQQPKQPKPDNANPFPEDTSNVPVTKNDGTIPAPDEAGHEASGPAPALPASDSDPVRSPDDAAGGNAAGGSSSSSSSSSLAGLDRVLPPPDDDASSGGSGHRVLHGKPAPAEHQETATEDVSVGEYYLSTKNWRAALSRYQSAMVLAPENPDVYWGLAEAERHTGDFAAAKANYQKLLDYDPDNKHAKDARHQLKDPEIANAQAAKPAAGPQ